MNFHECSIIPASRSKLATPEQGARDKFCYKRILREKNRKFNTLDFNFTTEDGNDKAMFLETIPSILLHAL
jgi:hypothetical protein